MARCRVRAAHKRSWTSVLTELLAREAKSFVMTSRQDMRDKLNEDYLKRRGFSRLMLSSIWLQRSITVVWLLMTKERLKFPFCR